MRPHENRHTGLSGHSKIGNIWAGDDWTAILNHTGTYEAPWIS
jgi:hypothetical protein